MAKRHAPGSIYEALDALMGEIEKKVGKNGYEAAADFENVTKFTLYKQVDPDNPVEMSFARVARLSAHFGALSALEYLAEQTGCVVVEKGKIGSDASLVAHLSSLASESGQAIQAIAEGIADNDLTDAELTRIAKEARELREAAAAAEMAALTKIEALRKNVTKIRGAA